GQSAAVQIGVRRALTEGIERALCIPGDCPALDPAELDGLPGDPNNHRADRGAGDGSKRVLPTSGGGAREAVIIPDRHGTGTNGLLLTPPDAIEPSFGPDSCERHVSLARAAGARCEIERPASLLLDLDTGADLAALQDHLGVTRAAAVRTRAVL